MNFEALLAAVCESFGLGGVEFSPEDATRLDFGGGLEVVVETSGDGRTLLLSACPGTRRGADSRLLAALLAANAYYANPGDAVLCYDEDSGDVTIRMCLDTSDLTGEGLADAIQSLVEEWQEWRDVLAGRAPEPAAGQVSPPGAGAAVGIMV